MTNRILSTGQRIFTPGLHIWPWDSGASERSVRRAKKRAPSSWLCKVANDHAEIRELLRSSCRNSWHVILCKNVLDARVSRTEEFYLSVTCSKGVLLRSLCATKRARPTIWSTHTFDRQQATKLIEYAKANFLQNAIYKKLEFTEINCILSRTLVTLYNKSFKHFFFSWLLCIVRTFLENNKC